MAVDIHYRCQLDLKMTRRITDLTKWMWCLVALHSATVWSPAVGIKVQNPPSNPSTVEAQAKFFQDFFSVQLSPYKIEFGHVCEDPNNWEQRYEKKDYKNHRDMGKVRWGDKKGGYGEHYWDLNHAGHNNDNDDGSYDHDHDHHGHGHDDGSYKEENTNDAYDEPSEQTLTYDNDSYDPEKASQFNENERSKRAHNLRTKPERKTPRDTQEELYKGNVREGKRQQQAHTYNVEESEENHEDDSESKKELTTRRPALKSKKPHEAEKESDAYNPTQDSDNEKVTLENVHDTYYKPQKLQQNVQDAYYNKPQKLQDQQFVPYEAGAGVRQHYLAAAAPRLFLEPSTGHVVDRATGQAYVLQPIIPNTNYQ